MQYWLTRLGDSSPDVIELYAGPIGADEEPYRLKLYLNARHRRYLEETLDLHERRIEFDVLSEEQMQEAKSGNLRTVLAPEYSHRWEQHFDLPISERRNLTSTARRNNPTLLDSSVEPIVHRPESSLTQALLIFATVILVLFIVFNTQMVTYTIIIWDVSISLALLLTVAAILGGCIVAISSLSRRLQSRRHLD